MTRNLTILMLLSLLFCSPLFSQSFDGVYQLGIEDQDGKVISKGTGFYVKLEQGARSYVLTSFHLLNSRLLEASRIKIIGETKNIYLKIAAYDELNDVLALYSDEISDQTWPLGSECFGGFDIAGYNNGKLGVVSVEDEIEDDTSDNIKRIPIYLRSGFSGAPLFNKKAEVCGMVVLSSEQNASSVAISNDIIRQLLNLRTNLFYSVRELRLMMGAERVAHSQEELDKIILDPNKERQLVIGLAPSKKTQRFVIRDAGNVIVDAYSEINKLLIHRSKNVMVRNLKVDRLMINESSGVSVTGCIFNTLGNALLLKDSSDLYVKGNLFKNIETGIILKASIVDENTLNSDNVFVSVINNIKNI